MKKSRENTIKAAQRCSGYFDMNIKPSLRSKIVKAYMLGYADAMSECASGLIRMYKLKQS